MARLGRAQANPPVIVRSALQDPPVLTTPTPVVVVGSSGRRGVPNEGQFVRSSLVDVVEVAAVTPAPLVITPPELSRPVVQAIIGRASLADVLAAVTPLVITPQQRAQLPNRPTISRSPLPDVVVPTQATPAPLVVSTVGRPSAGRVFVGRAPLSEMECTVLRPNTGTVSRPLTGLTARPSSGTTTRPGTGIVVRPDTGIVENPC